MPRARCLPSPRCCLPRIRGHSGSPLLFFLLSTRFATSLTFVFRSFYPSFSLQAGVLRRLRRLSTRRPELSSNILVLLLDSVEEPDASTVGTGAKVRSPVDADSGGASQASALRQQENFSKEHAAVALVVAKKRSVSTRTSSSLEHRAINERLPRNEESSAKVFHHLPSAGRVSNCAARWPRLRQHLSKNAEPRGRSGRLSQLENREFSLGSLVGDIGKQWTLEWQQGVVLNSTMELNDQRLISASNRRWNGNSSSLSRPQQSPTMHWQH